jgi:glycosyltransferase involved in cell wall biosynthesis
MSPSPPSDPRVSVVMPAFNGAHWLQRALASLLTQTFADIEVIVVDDGSTDDTAAIVADAAAKDPRIVILHQQQSGIATALNRGVAEARGEYIGRLDTDDIAAPDRFERQVAFMDAHPDVGVVGGSMVRIDAHDRKLHRMRYPTENVATEMLKYSALAHPAVLMRRSLLLELGGYRRAFRYSGDYDLWLRMAERTHLANLPDVVTYYRVHPAQVSLTHTRFQTGCAIVAREIAFMRRAGKPDLITDATVINAESLPALGIDPRQLPAMQAYFQ